MPFILTLMTDKAMFPLSPDLIDRVSHALHASNQEPGEPEWLSAEEACDVSVEGDVQRIGEIAAQVIGELPIDHAVLPAHGRRKRLLIADMDSTMIGQECIDELADEIGQMEAVSGITERAMNGEIEFEPALRERVGLLKGIPVETIERVLAKRITLTPGAKTLVQTMKRIGATTALVSGGFTAFAMPLAEIIGFERVHANRLIESDGLLAGTVAEPIVGRDAKLETLRKLADENNLKLADCLAVGDGANDLAMLGASGLGVAYHAKPTVRTKAKIQINYCDLTALLFLQGYRREEFAG